MRVFFNASVILAGVRSPDGASGEMLKRTKSGKIEGVISELVADEAIRHAQKARVTGAEMERVIEKTFGQIMLAPESDVVEKFKGEVIDPDDVHVLVSAKSERGKILVTLDKKHLLVLQGKIKGLEILSPGQFLEKYRMD